MLRRAYYGFHHPYLCMSVRYRATSAICNTFAPWDTLGMTVSAELTDIFRIASATCLL